MKIEVKSAEVGVKSGVSKKNGKPYSIREQRAWLHNASDPYPQGCVLQLEDSQEPYPPGMYETADELRVGAFGRLEVSRSMRLIPSSARKVA